MKRLCALALCLWLALSGALAEDCFTLDVDALKLDLLSSDDYIASALSSAAQGIRIRKQISSSSEVAESIRLTLTQMDTRTLVFDKNYGYQSGTFDSGVLYLPYAGEGTTPYLVTLYAGDYVYALPFMHQQRRMHQNGACTTGVRLCDLDPAQSSDWVMGTMLDLDDLRNQGSLTVDICASNSYVIGSATIALTGSELSVELHFSSAADVELEDADLYVITDGNVLSSTRARSLNSAVDVSGADKALVYVDMQLSYDPAGLPAFHYDSDTARSQQRLWNDAHETQSASSSWEEPESSFASEDEWSDGWSSGWDDGWSDGWSSGW